MDSTDKKQFIAAVSTILVAIIGVATSMVMNNFVGYAFILVIICIVILLVIGGFFLFRKIKKPGNKQNAITENGLTYKGYEKVVDYLTLKDIDPERAIKMISEYEDLNKFLVDIGLSEKNAIETLRALSQRKSLLTHDFFTVGKRELLSRVYDKSKNLEGGKVKKSIPDYIEFLIIQTVEGHKQYLEQYADIIYDETQTLDTLKYLEDFLTNKDRLKKEAIEIRRFSPVMVEKFGDIIKPALDKFIHSVKRIANSSLVYNDYMRFYTILESVMNLFDWITCDYINEILCMNGDLEEE